MHVVVDGCQDNLCQKHHVPISLKKKKRDKFKTTIQNFLVLDFKTSIAKQYFAQSGDWVQVLIVAKKGIELAST